MIIGKLIFKFFPENTFKSLRKRYRKLLNLFYKPLNENDLRDILSNKLLIKKGSVVLIHSSIESLSLNFGSLRLFEILLDTVGDEGTLVFPCWHFTYRAEEYLNTGKVFDVKRSPSVMGMLSEIARRHPAAHRSYHPINSIVAIGKHADYITRDHHNDIYPCGEKSPYYKVIELDGIIAGIGVNVHFMSSVHCPEDILKNNFPVKTRLDKVFDAAVKTPDGNIITVKTLAAHPQIKNNDINGYVKKYIHPSVCRNINVKGNRFFYASAAKLFSSMIELAKTNKTIYNEKANERN